MAIFSTEETVLNSLEILRLQFKNEAIHYMLIAACFCICKSLLALLPLLCDWALALSSSREEANALKVSENAINSAAKPWCSPPPKNINVCCDGNWQVKVVKSQQELKLCINVFIPCGSPAQCTP